MRRLLAVVVALCVAWAVAAASARHAGAGRSAEAAATAGAGDGFAAEVAIEQMLRADDATAHAIAEDILARFRFAQADGLFVRRAPANGTQLPNFGAVVPWSDVLRALNASAGSKLVHCIRHGQAWENVSPWNRLCWWRDAAGTQRPVFDSPVTPLGLAQADSLNALLQQPAPTAATWLDALGLRDAPVITSPITRAMQTARAVFRDRAVREPYFITDLARANIGEDTCNYRRPVSTPSTTYRLSAPWNTGCDYTNETLLSVWRGDTFTQLTRADMGLAEIWAHDPFNITVRPPGGPGLALQFDSDTFWRSDTPESGGMRMARMAVVLAQVWQALPGDRVVALVTHSEMCSALNQLLGAGPLQQGNVQDVPYLITPR